MRVSSVFDQEDEWERVRETTRRKTVEVVDLITKYYRNRQYG